MSGASPPASTPAGTPPKPALQRYGRYVLVDRLGAGGMAEVFRAVATGPEQFQRVVVVKRVLPHLSENSSFVQMFIDEATLCGRLSHPNIIQVYEFGQQDDTYFIAMEYVEGRNLSNILTRLVSRGQLVPVNVTAEIVRQSCLGLGYAHALKSPDGKALGIVHRDVTPSNIMIAYTGAVKLLDFGIARVADEARTSTTDAGQVKGKSSYLAPEQLKAGAPIDGRVDIFTVGIVLHEALTGKRLFKGTNPLQTMKLVQEMEVPTPSKVNPAVPRRLDEIVMRALQRKPEARYASANDMAEALEQFLIEQRFSSQELPKFMTALFPGEGGGVSLPQAELKALMAAPPSRSLPALTAEALGETPVSGEDETATPVLGVEGDQQGLASRRRLLILTGVGAAVLTMLALFVFGALKPTLPAPAPAAVVVPDKPVPPPLAMSVQISISSQPAGAQVFLVGEARVLGTTPVTLTFPRARQPLEFRVQKDGHVSATLRVVPDVDKPAVVTLAPRPPELRSPSKPSRPRPTPTSKVRNAVPIDPFK